MNMTAVPLRNAGIGLGNYIQPGLRFGHSTDRGDEIARPYPAICPDSYRRRRQFSHKIGQCSGQNAHHGAACRVKACGDRIGNAHSNGSAGGGADFFQRGHGFNPCDIGTALFQSAHLLGENGHGLVFGQRAQRRKQIPRRANRARHNNGTTGLVGHVAGKACTGDIQLMHAPFGLMQHQAAGIAAKCIGEDNVRTRINKILMQTLNFRGLIDIPQFRRIARLQATLKQIGAGGTIGEQEGLFIQEFLQHDINLSLYGYTKRGLGTKVKGDIKNLCYFSG